MHWEGQVGARVEAGPSWVAGWIGAVKTLYSRAQLSYSRLTCHGLRYGALSATEGSLGEAQHLAVALIWARDDLPLDFLAIPAVAGRLLQSGGGQDARAVSTQRQQAVSCLGSAADAPQPACHGWAHRSGMRSSST